VWSRLAVSICVIFLAAGCDSRPDTERLQGEWVLWEMNGGFEFELATVKGGPTKIVFTGDQFIFMNDPGPGHQVNGTFHCDPAKRPGVIIFHFGDRTVAGIYSVSRTTLQICVGKDDAVAPAMFAGGPGERPALLVFSRPKAE
jgi:uncharacterized protein (TIGR03067 family)